MSVRDDIRDGAAKAAFDICRDLGVQATYTPLATGGSAVNVYCMPDDESTTEGNALEITTEQTAKRFFVPKQTGFPPTNGVRTKAKFEAESVTYFVESMDMDALRAGYVLTCTRDHAALIGDR